MPKVYSGPRKCKKLDVRVKKFPLPGGMGLKVSSGPWKCMIDKCNNEVEHGTKSLKMHLLNHFIRNHGVLSIRDFRVKNIGFNETLEIHHIFKFVGQCNVNGCFMIKGVCGRDETDGRYELKRTFVKHFKSKHNRGIPDYRTLVETLKTGEVVSKN